MFRINSIPMDFSWHNEPEGIHPGSPGTLSIAAGKKTDFFIDPSSGEAKGNAPLALFDPGTADFLLSARVKVEFAGTFDAGSLHVRIRDDLWGKLCLEYSPQRQPMVVSVVTRGVSDDCNSAIIEGPQVYLRVCRRGRAFVFHYSLDGRLWHLVRNFSLGNGDGVAVKAGFSAQAPIGEGCTASFSDIRFVQATLADIRSGE